MYPTPIGMQCSTVTYLIALETLLSQSAGELVIMPHHTESKVGDLTYFNCSTDIESVEIFWFHGDKYIYNGFGILEPYNGRFEIDRSASIGSHNLVIHSVEPSDAGEYVCADDDGSGRRRSAQLIVLDKDPVCQSNIQPDGVVGQNVFNIPPDEVQLRCTVTYHGKISPQMKWKKIVEDESIRESLTSAVRSKNHLMYTLKLKGDIPLDNSSYVCQTTRSTQRQLKCTSETIKVLYFVEGHTIEQNVFRGESITCIASNSTLPCISQWYHDNNNSCPMSCDETITTHLLGVYMCTVKCHVRGRDYYFEAMKVFVSESLTSSLLSTSGTIIIAAPIVIIIAIVPIAVLIVRNRLLKRKYAQRKFKEIERFQFLLAVKDHYKTDKMETRNDLVAEDEIELGLLYQETKKSKTSLDGMIFGSALLGERLFIVRENTSKLEVYDCNYFKSGRKFLNVCALVNAVDMCSCKRNYCLYVINSKTSNNEVLRFSTHGKLLKKWSIGDNSGNVSATDQGNIIVTVQEKHMLSEYSSNGQWMYDINISECTNPWHAIKRDNRYIVSHGSFSDHLHRVCIVDDKGKVYKSFGRESGSTKNQLNVPCHFAVLSSGCVIVVDLFNDRVLLLDSDLEFKAIIVPKYRQRFLFPVGVCLDEQRLVLAIRAGDPKNPILEEEDESREETVGGATSKESSCLLENSKIQEDSRILVFDIKPLL